MLLVRHGLRGALAATLALSATSIASAGEARLAVGVTPFEAGSHWIEYGPENLGFDESHAAFGLVGRGVYAFRYFAVGLAVDGVQWIGTQGTARELRAGLDLAGQIPVDDQNDVGIGLRLGPTWGSYSSGTFDSSPSGLWLGTYVDYRWWARPTIALFTELEAHASILGSDYKGHGDVFSAAIGFHVGVAFAPTRTSGS